MQGNWAHNEAYHRCRFPHEYALANKIDRPLNVYLREADLLGPVDAWLAQAFAPAQIEHSLTVMEQAQPNRDIETEALQRTLTGCERALARHRAALEAGADPALVATWSREVQAQRAVTEAKLAHLDQGAPPGTECPVTRSAPLSTPWAGYSPYCEPPILRVRVPGRSHKTWEAASSRGSDGWPVVMGAVSL